MRSKADYREFSDKLLVLLLKESDDLGFNEIVNRYYELSFSFAYRRLQDKELARDIVQDAFTKIWEKRLDLVYDLNLGGYVIQMLKNRIINHYQHLQIESKYIENFAKLLKASQSNADHLVRHNDLSALIEAEVAALPEKMRVIYELSRKQHMNRKEIAEHLSVPEGNVKITLQRMLKILRNKLPSA